MGSFKGHALPGSFFLVAGIWWTGKHSLWHATRRNKNIGSTRLASRTSQRRLEIIESCVVLFFSFVGRQVFLVTYKTLLGRVMYVSGMNFCINPAHTKAI